MATKKQAPPPPKPVEEEMNYEQFDATGFETVQQSDLGIPFLTIVQKGSPEIDKTHKDYATKRIEGVQVGDIVETLTRSIVYVQDEDPVQFIASKYVRVWVEWKARDSGGGLVKVHSNMDVLAGTTRNEKGQDVKRDGNVVITTAYWFGQYYHGEKWTQAVIGMTSTQLKKARMWLNIMMSHKSKTGTILPMFSRIYHLSTVAEQNAKGSWMGWKIESGRLVQEDNLLTEAANMSKGAAEGFLMLPSFKPESPVGDSDNDGNNPY